MVAHDGSERAGTAGVQSARAARYGGTTTRTDREHHERRRRGEHAVLHELHDEQNRAGPPDRMPRARDQGVRRGGVCDLTRYRADDNDRVFAALERGPDVAAVVPADL